MHFKEAALKMETEQPRHLLPSLTVQLLTNLHRVAVSIVVEDYRQARENLRSKLQLYRRIAPHRSAGKLKCQQSRGPQKQKQQCNLLHLVGKHW